MLGVLDWELLISLYYACKPSRYCHPYIPHSAFPCLLSIPNAYNLLTILVQVSNNATSSKKDCIVSSLAEDNMQSASYVSACMGASHANNVTVHTKLEQLSHICCFASSLTTPSQFSVTVWIQDDMLHHSHHKGNVQLHSKRSLLT